MRPRENKTLLAVDLPRPGPYNRPLIYGPHSADRAPRKARRLLSLNVRKAESQFTRTIKRHMKSSNAFAALIEPLQRAVAEEGYTTPTPIQEQAIPPLLAGRDLLGCAQTGTGKTAAFTLPLLQELTLTVKPAQPHHPRSLILTPTRELAAQIGESIRTYGRHLRVTHTVIFGGVGQHPQTQALRRGPDVVVATPGRLIDLMDQGEVRLDQIELFILDEADRMLDMGFLPAVRKIIGRLPSQRHSLFFSATMPPAVAELAHTLLKNPVQITVSPGQPAVERIAQQLLFVDKENKDALLSELIEKNAMDRVIVFTRTKHGADKAVRKLASAGISSAAIHGNKSQNARTTALAGFKTGRIRALVATDIAARGLDVDGITHVVNYDLPEEPETYVHRIGRTARAGADGDAVSFCAARERDWLRGIEKMIRKPIPVEINHRYHSETARHASGAEARPEPKTGRGNAPRSRRAPAPARNQPARSYGNHRPHARSR